MKQGIVWFLHLNNLIYGMRIALIPLFILGVVIPIPSKLFILIWTLFAICGVISLITMFVLTPSTKTMTHFIESCENEFESRMKLEFSEKHSQVNVLKLRCYVKGSFHRVLQNRMIYGTLVMMAVVTSTDGKWLVTETQSLLRKAPRKREIYRINDSEQIQVETLPEKDENARLVIKCGEVSIDVLTHEDYHLKDFISALNR